MDQREIEEAIGGIARRFCDVSPTSIFSGAGAPFDIAKPTLHDTKAEFLAEKRQVNDALRSSRSMMDLLLLRYPDEGQNPGAGVESLAAHIDTFALGKRRDSKIEYPIDLVRKNSAQVGLWVSLAFHLSDFINGLQDRLVELERQERIFWNVKGRPPNFHARKVALNFAKFIAQGTGARPTVGTSSDGSHPSTDFGRALEEIFSLLRLDADWRSAARWAVSELKDDDLRPAPQYPSGLMGTLLGHPGNALAPRNALIDLMEKKGHE